MTDQFTEFFLYIAVPALFLAWVGANRSPDSSVSVAPAIAPEDLNPTPVYAMIMEPETQEPVALPSVPAEKTPAKRTRKPRAKKQTQV